MDRYALTLLRANRGRVIGAHVLDRETQRTSTFDEEEVSRALAQARGDYGADPYDGGKLAPDEYIIAALLHIDLEGNDR